MRALAPEGRVLNGPTSRDALMPSIYKRYATRSKKCCAGWLAKFIFLQLPGSKSDSGEALCKVRSLGVSGARRDPSSGSWLFFFAMDDGLQRVPHSSRSLREWEASRRLVPSSPQRFALRHPRSIAKGDVPAGDGGNAFPRNHDSHQVQRVGCSQDDALAVRR